MGMKLNRLRKLKKKGAAEGKRRKEEGLDQVEGNNLSWVEEMRVVAKSVSRKEGQVSADDLRVYADDNNFHPEHPNAWGSIFRGTGWKKVGRKKSDVVTRHSGEIAIWCWEGA